MPVLALKAASLEAYIRIGVNELTVVVSSP